MPDWSRWYPSKVLERKNGWEPLIVDLTFKSSPFFFSFFKNYTLGSGVHVQIMQDCCIGTHMAMWLAASIPCHLHLVFLPMLSLPNSPPPVVPSLVPPHRPQYVMLPSLCLCVLIVQYPPMIGNMQWLIFFSCVSLLRMMVSRFIHDPTKDMNSLLFMAA